MNEPVGNVECVYLVVSIHIERNFSQFLPIVDTTKPSADEL